MAKKKGIQLSAFSILFLIIIALALLTWVFPQVDNATLATVVMAPFNGFKEAIDVCIFILLLGGFLGVVTKTGALDAGVGALVKKLKGKEIINILIGKVSAMIKSNRFDEQDYFGCGNEFEGRFWMALLRQVMVNGLIRKDIETYGVMFLTEKGKEFLKKPTSFMMTEDHNFEDDPEEPVKNTTSLMDETLLKLLRELRKKVAKDRGVPPFVVFQDASLEDMSLKYPITIPELTNVFGVGEGKAKKYGQEFIELIAKYVEENDIIRPEDLVVKTTGTNSALKLFIIQNVDKKLPLPDIAKAKGLNMNDFLKELEQIVYSGTKLKIDYWIDEILDEEQQEELHEYFLEAESDKISLASKEFNGDYEDDELRLYRIKFISEVGN